MTAANNGSWRKLSVFLRSLVERVLANIVTQALIFAGGTALVWYGTSFWGNPWLQVVSIFLFLLVAISGIFLWMAILELRKQTMATCTPKESTAQKHHFLDWKSPRGLVAHVVDVPTLLVNSENSRFNFDLCIHNQTNMQAQIADICAYHVGASVPNCRNLPAVRESETEQITIEPGRCRTIPGVQLRVDIRDDKRQQIYQHTCFREGNDGEGLVEFGFHILKIRLTSQDAEEEKEVIVNGPLNTRVSYADMERFRDDEDED